MFYERLAELCKERNEKMTPVLEKLNISKGSMANWKKGRDPSSDVAKKISSYFGVSVDYLLGISDERNKPIREDELTPEEIRFIGLVKKLRPEELTELNGIVEYLIAKRSSDE